MKNVLIIEDNQTLREGMCETLQSVGYRVFACDNGVDGIKQFKNHLPDFVITDLKMNPIDGIEVLKQIKSIEPATMVMVITAFGTVDVAVEAMKLGAFDFITKPFTPQLLRVKVKQAFEIIQLNQENQFYRTEMAPVSNHLIGSSSCMVELRDLIAKVAKSDSTVLITGESGTGKELIARSIHEQSSRKNKPFIKTDCAALTQSLLESELFGHEKGAFTGAIQRKSGRFEIADGGTIFLDEIGEIPLEVQSKLLRVLQDQTFERVGGQNTIKVDVRVIAATNRKLKEEVQKGRFREDLFYRLFIVPIEAPTLRDRLGDVQELCMHFTKHWEYKTGDKKQFTNEVLSLLSKYDWPGNVRELENTLERIFVLSNSSLIDLKHLPTEFNFLNQEKDSDSSDLGYLNEALESLEKKMILKALKESGYVKTKAAQILGVKTSALYYKMEKYGIA